MRIAMFFRDSVQANIFKANGCSYLALKGNLVCDDSSGYLIKDAPLKRTLSVPINNREKPEKAWAPKAQINLWP